MIALRHIAAFGGGGFIVAALIAFDFGTGSASVPRWLAIYILAAAALLMVAWRRSASVGAVDLLAGAFLAYAGLSLAWSGDPGAGLLQWQNLACLTAVALLIRHTRALDSMLLPALSLSAIMIVFLGLALPQYHGGTGNENFQAETLLLILPMLALLPHRNAYATLMAVAAGLAVVAFLIGWNGSHTPYVALAALVGGGVAWLAYRRLWLILAVLGPILGISGYVVATSFNVLGPIEQSLVERAEIWINVAAMMADKPLFGHGFGAFDYAYPRSAHVGIIPGTFLSSPTDFIGSAHNDYLQLYTELGFVGFVLAGALVWSLVSSPGDQTRLAARLTLIVVSSLALIGFPLQNPASAMVVAVAAGLASRGGPLILTSRRLNLLGLFVLPLVVSAAFFTASQAVAKDIRLNMAHNPAVSLMANLKAHDLYPFDRWVRLQSILTLATVMRSYGEKATLSPEAADRVFEIASSASPHHPALLMARVEHLLVSGRWREPENDIEGLMARLREHGPFYPQTWALDVYVAGLAGDEARAQASAARGLAMPEGETHFRRMKLLKEPEE